MTASPRSLKCAIVAGALLLVVVSQAGAQIQLDIKLARLQYIAYEPVIATVGITNLAGRDVELRDTGSQAWFGFEITGAEGQPIAASRNKISQPPLRIEAGKRVTQKINLTPLYAVHELGTYHVRAYIHFHDLDRFFYSPRKVFTVTDARPIWQKTVGVPGEASGPGRVRTYSLMTNRFPNRTSLYVRVEDKDTGIVYATESLGRIISMDEPQAQLDRENQLHILHCAGPRSWAYTRIGLNGEVLARSAYLEAKSRPRLFQAPDGNVVVKGGLSQDAVNRAGAAKPVPKLSDRPPAIPKP
ncbi:MAG TPA: hypothetical protein VJ719_08510 [Chthoniobacterales bacterium]|nr:hypothetical protein [Chthoniobacterales bacterium]